MQLVGCALEAIDTHVLQNSLGWGQQQQQHMLLKGQVVTLLQQQQHCNIVRANVCIRRFRLHD